MGNIKKNYRKIKRNKIMTWALMWLNRSVATINATLQLLDIYRLDKIISITSYFLAYSHREHKEMVDMGLLDVTNDVCTECYSS